LNGVPVFAKGANYIPNDNFVPRVTPEKYELIVKSAADANMNMLRVWGGGIYENDIFYDLCDKYGIMIWQDFIFACAMYPGDEAFLENIKQEAIQNVKRLRNHPCIAIWCGNNEMDIAWSTMHQADGAGKNDLMNIPGLKSGTIMKKYFIISCLKSFMNMIRRHFIGPRLRWRIGEYGLLTPAPRVICITGACGMAKNHSEILKRSSAVL